MLNYYNNKNYCYIKKILNVRLTRAKTQQMVCLFTDLSGYPGVDSRNLERL